MSILDMMTELQVFSVASVAHADKSFITLNIECQAGEKAHRNTFILQISHNNGAPAPGSHFLCNQKQNDILEVKHMQLPS